MKHIQTFTSFNESKNEVPLHPAFISNTHPIPDILKKVGFTEKLFEKLLSPSEAYDDDGGTTYEFSPTIHYEYGSKFITDYNTKAIESANDEIFIPGGTLMSNTDVCFDIADRLNYDKAEEIFAEYDIADEPNEVLEEIIEMFLGQRGYFIDGLMDRLIR